ncbi:unnamed protein product [Ceutorhynchus assimilis]|uniref:carbonic anhydrase n=1 Tax=Ceutorhynchus assimilis TaxID=467358 RepID=A0A9N9MJT1_9CUCU|nr:unnamed protein product [Ceutorhynchus assimilis]
MTAGAVFFVCVFVEILQNYGTICQDFGYDGTEGPNYWGAKYAQCVGKHQSPIDIEVTKAITKHFPPLVFSHFDEPIQKAFLINNGHTVQMKINSDPKPTIKGGPLSGEFEFAQLHYHWGQNDTVGSESQFDHHTYPGEMHIVFFDKRYKDFTEAGNKPSGLTVLAFIIIIDEHDNLGYDNFEDGLKDVIDESANRTFNNLDSLSDLTRPEGERSFYYTYEGSLTTPPCSEVVTWIEFTNPLPMSREQINAFRKLFSKNGPLTHNYRPIQPLNDRIVYFNGADSKLPMSHLTTVLIIVACVYNIF